MEQIAPRFRDTPLSKETSEASAKRPLGLSVVVPVCERRDDLQRLYLEYSDEISKVGLPYEFIFVVDGPMPEVLGLLRQLKKEHSNILLITLNRSFGEAAALSAGFERASGSLIVSIASYFQVEPYEVGRLVKRVLDGEDDVAVAWRHPRIDSSFNQFQSWIYHGIIRLLIGTEYHDVSCGLRVMKREVADEVSVYGDLHRFFPIAAYQRGFRVSEISVQQSPLDAKRRVHQPGVYLRRLLDILTFFFLYKFTKKPLRFFGLIGSCIFAVGAVLMGYLVLERVFGIALAGRPLLIFSVLFMVFGIQLFSTGLLAEIIIFTHASQMKEYTIKEILD